MSEIDNKFLITNNLIYLYRQYLFKDSDFMGNIWGKERLNYIISLLSAILVVFCAYAYPAETFLGVIVLISPGIPIMLVVFIIYKLYNQKPRTST